MSQTNNPGNNKEPSGEAGQNVPPSGPYNPSNYPPQYNYGPPPNYPPNQPPPPNYPPYQPPTPNYPPNQPPPNYPPQYNYGPPPNYPPYQGQPPRQNSTGKGCLIAFLICLVILVVGGGLVLTVTGIVLKGVGLSASSGLGSKSQGNLDACAVLKAAEISAILGDQYTQDEDKQAALCPYSSDATTLLQVSLDRGDHEDFVLQRKILGGLGGAFNNQPSPVASVASNFFGNGQIQDVGGLGDEAFWTGNQLVVRKGDKILGLMFTNLAAFAQEKSVSLDKMKELAQKALSRM